MLAPTQAESKGRNRAIFGAAALVATGLCLVPLDASVRAVVYNLRIGGDFKRELEFLQQFGAVSSVVILIIVVLLLDDTDRTIKWRRIADWIAAACLTGATGHLLKIAIGRPRPLYNDSLYICGPIGKYPVQLKDGSIGLIHAWDYGSGVASELWSMPSSHAMAAASLAVALTALYPRLRWLCLALVIIVCAARVLLGAHYPSDVFIGAGLGFGLASTAMNRRWGSRLASLIVPPPKSSPEAALPS
ncbi:MAG: phosphatase PAP2 family protein [Planctomycetes bacterium]|nr:phosphatase PAP2 family protein [Planctomycetota bacterium]